MPLMGRAISAIRERLGDDTEVLVQYEDQPFNEWKSLFNYTQGTQRLPGVPVYTEEHSNVFVTASGTSFYEQCYPTASVQVGMSFTAMHWLSKLPCDLQATLHSTQAEPDEKAKFMAQSQQDWRSILKRRSAELALGGRFVFVNFCESTEGYYLGNTDRGANMYSTFAELWRELVDDGTITEAEFAACTFPNHYKTMAETLAPFEEADGTFEGLRVVSCEERVVRCPYLDEYLAAKERGEAQDSATHARDFVPTMRTWSNSTFANALDATRPAEERAAIVDRMFGMYEARVAANPEEYHMDYVHCYLVVERV
eukprot:PRCOL_00003058-RA